MPVSDSELIERIRGGEKHIYASLIDRHKDQAMTLAMRILKNREDAEEAAQDAFVRAYYALGKFEGASSFSTWLYRIVYNVCLTRVSRRREEILQIEYDDEIDHKERASATWWSSLASLEQKDMISVIKGIIDAMPAKYSSILSLFYFQELTYEEIVEVTRLPLGTVKVQLFRARTMLHRQLEKELEMEKAV